jgi:SAM-dependent methyltransferase
MVHALQEIRRVLIREGTLIDLRPLAGNWPVEVVSLRATHEVGRVTDLPQGLEDDAAANRTIARAADDGWFLREKEEMFPLYYYWDSPKDLEDYVEENWSDFIAIDQAIYKKLRSVWALADADARVRVRANMLITRWRKAA